MIQTSAGKEQKIRHLYRIQAATGKQHIAAIFTGYRQRQVDSIQPPSLQDTDNGR
jgi:hypothetical protein